MYFRNIFKHSLKLSWHNKYLWFFGLFAALLGNNNEFEILSGSLSGGISQTFLPSFRELAATGIFSRQVIIGLSKILTEDPWPLLLLLFFGFVVVVLAVFLFCLAVVSQAALVYSSAGIINNKKYNFRASIIFGMKKFWSVFTLNALSKIIIFLVFSLLSLSIIINFKIIYIFIFIILIPLTIIFSFIIKYAVAYVVVNESSLNDSVRKGWGLFKNNWFISIKMAFLLFAISFIVSLAIVLLIINLNTVFAFLTMLFIKAVPAVGFWIFIVLKSLLAFIIIMFMSIFITVFQISSWTDLFMRLDGKSRDGKIGRAVGKIGK